MKYGCRLQVQEIQLIENVSKQTHLTKVLSFLPHHAYPRVCFLFFFSSYHCRLYWFPFTAETCSALERVRLTLSVLQAYWNFFKCVQSLAVRCFKACVCVCLLPFSTSTPVSETQGSWTLNFTQCWHLAVRVMCFLKKGKIQNNNPLFSFLVNMLQCRKSLKNKEKQLHETESPNFWRVLNKIVKT